MARKELEKAEAIALRRQGKTYSEILLKVPVAKSTLAFWLHDVGLAEYQKQRITEKRIQGQMRGAQARRTQRIVLAESIWENAQRELGRVTERDLWMMGICLYWAEGSKERNKFGVGLSFSNSDPEMIQLFLRWLQDILKVKNEDILFEIYLHENHKYRASEVRKKWSEFSGFPVERFEKVYYKKNKINTKRTNVGNLYYGQLRVKVKASSRLYRRVDGWKKAICKQYCGIV